AAILLRGAAGVNRPPHVSPGRLPGHAMTGTSSLPRRGCLRLAGTITLDPGHPARKRIPTAVGDARSIAFRPTPHRRRVVERDDQEARACRAHRLAALCGARIPGNRA